MSKKIKMALYAEPGVGKSVFASKAPKPFFFTTDGNYAWLEDFGADPNAHVRLNSWEDAKREFAKSYDEYETLVVDLTEDLFKWCEFEYCLKNRIEHVSDIGYGKAYDITRNEFFLEMCKLINIDKHIIFLMHGVTYTTKDRRGVEHTKHGPTTRIPDKVVSMLEGRVRYFLRAYLKAEEIDGALVKKRYLSLVPKENEFGIIRGIDENTIPHDIPLEFDEFAKYIGVKTNSKAAAKVTKTDKEKLAETTKKVQDIDTDKIKSEEPKKHVEKQIEVKAETQVEKPAEPEPNVDTVEKPVENVEVEKKSIDEPVKETVQPSNEDKLAAIKAKLAAIKAAK